MSHPRGLLTIALLSTAGCGALPGTSAPNVVSCTNSLIVGRWATSSTSATAYITIGSDCMFSTVSCQASGPITSLTRDSTSTATSESGKMSITLTEKDPNCQATALKNYAYTADSKTLNIQSVGTYTRL